jgi:hypothetical protein
MEDALSLFFHASLTVFFAVGRARRWFKAARLSWKKGNKEASDGSNEDTLSLNSYRGTRNLWNFLQLSICLSIAA